jgi:hypothetical protein
LLRRDVHSAYDAFRGIDEPECDEAVKTFFGWIDEFARRDAMLTVTSCLINSSATSQAECLTYKTLGNARR